MKKLMTLNSGKACYNFVTVFCQLFKNKRIKIYGTANMPLVLYGCKTWSLKLREHRLRVFENTETKKIFQHKRQELSADCRILPKEELRDLYFLPIRWAGHVARTMEKRNTNRVLAGITGIDYLEDLNIEEKIILKWILQK
jgi:hypothetical protein